MRMPPLPITMAVIAIIWCVAGYLLHGWRQLLYPAAWLAVLGLFLILNKVYDALHAKPADAATDRAKSS